MVSSIDNVDNIHKNQFGFLKGRNTSDAILEFLNNAYNSLNGDHHLIAVYLYFSKVFDTIPHEALLRKPDHLGFRGVVYRWIESYLKDKKQNVSIGETCSGVTDDKMGVPQGQHSDPSSF